MHPDCVQINEHGNVLLDEYVLPGQRVTGYRTFVSGIRPKDLKGAAPRAAVQKRVRELIRGCVVVGHAMHFDDQVRLVG